MTINMIRNCIDITLSPNFALVFTVRIHLCSCFTIEIPCKILHIRECPLKVLKLLSKWVYNNPWPEPWTYQENEPLSRPSYAEPGPCVWSTTPEQHWPREAVSGCTLDLVTAAQDHVLIPRTLNTFIMLLFTYLLILIIIGIMMIKCSYHKLYKPP